MATQPAPSQTQPPPRIPRSACFGPAGTRASRCSMVFLSWDRGRAFPGVAKNATGAVAPRLLPL